MLRGPRRDEVRRFEFVSRGRSRWRFRRESREAAAECGCCSKQEELAAGAVASRRLESRNLKHVDALPNLGAGVSTETVHLPLPPPEKRAGRSLLVTFTPSYIAVGPHSIVMSVGGTILLDPISNEKCEAFRSRSNSMGIVPDTQPEFAHGCCCWAANKQRD